MMKHLSQITKKWYAVYVRSRHEKSVHEILQEKGIESSLPFKTVYKQWSDRKKKVKLPMFRGYVFVKIDIKKERLDVLQTDGVVKFITFGVSIVAIPEMQMYWLDMLMPEPSMKYEQEYPVGVDVEVIRGPFWGLQGRVKKNNSDTRLVVWCDVIMQGVSVEVDPKFIKVCDVQRISESLSQQNNSNLNTIKQKMMV